MAFSIFKKDQPIHYLVATAIIVTATCAVWFLQPNIQESTFPSLLSFYLDGALGASLGLALTLATAFLLAFVLNRHEQLKPASFTPYLLFGITLSLLPENLFANSLQLANACFIWACYKLLYLPSQKIGGKIVFEASFMLGLGALFYWPSYFGGLATILVVLITGHFNARNLILWLVGLVFPWLLARAIYFLMDWPFATKMVWKAPNLIVLFNNPLVGVTFIFCLLASLIGLFFFFKSMEKTTVELRYQKRILGLMLFSWIIAAWGVFFTAVNGTLFFALITPVVAFLGSLILYFGKSRIVSAFFLTLLVVLSVYNTILAISN